MPAVDRDGNPERDDSKGGGSGITVQVGASAAAAVTSALAASFFGVAGTLIGAAVGSIVSTIAGALYTHYLARAHERLRVTTDVVIQRIPGDVLTATPLRHLAPTSPTGTNSATSGAASPGAVPGRDSMRPIGDERGDETVAVPVSEAGDLLKVPEGRAYLNGQTADGQTANGSRNGSAGANTGPGATWWKRPMVALGAVSVAGFLIALGVVLVSEQAIGHPLSGGSSGNSISKITGGDTDKKSDDDTPATTSTPTASESADSNGSNDEAQPTATAPETEPTPSSEATEPEAPVTDAPDTSSSAGAGAADAPAATAAP